MDEDTQDSNYIDPDELYSAHLEQAKVTLRTNPPALLADVYEIDWENLYHAYGPATDVPLLLLLLLSDDELIREDVYGTLYGNIWHQGTVYEASAYAMPFLLRMLAHPETPDKANILYLLASLAEGNSYLAVHHQEGTTSDWREILTRDGKDFDEELRKERSWVAATNRAVGEGVALYLSLLDDEELRSAAASVLCVVRDRAHEMVPPLVALLNTITDTGYREQLVEILSVQMDASEGSQQLFHNLVEQPESETLAYVAAVALARRAREHTPESAVDAIVAKVSIDIREGTSSYGNDIWLEQTLETLLLMGNTRALPALLRVLPHLDRKGEIEQVSGILLAVAFHEETTGDERDAVSWRQQIHRAYHDDRRKERAPRGAETLTEPQRAALMALIEYAPLWQYTKNLLEVYGLPTDREGLRALLA
jgi:hypothetical protein